MAQIFYNHEKNNKERTTDTKINEHKNVKYFQAMDNTMSFHTLSAHLQHCE